MTVQTDINPLPPPPAPDIAGFTQGVFFGMPEDDYFAVPALSASGVKNLRMSPLDFWARARWLNPNYEDDNEEAEDNIARILGKAYHKRILEGREVFLRCYAPELEAEAHHLVTDDHLKKWLADHDMPTTGKRKQDRVDRILEAQPSMAANIWDCAVDAYTKSHEGKTFISAKYMDKIELAAAMIERDPQLGKAFTGGMPEVSIFWVCPTIGVPCKARIDYLKPKAIVDLKTFANKSGYPIDRAIDREFGYNRYSTQGAWYYDAADQIAGLMHAGKVYGEAPHDYLKALHANHEKTFLYVFQQKGVAPLARGKLFPRYLTNCLLAAANCEAAKQTYRTCTETFAPGEPWLTSVPITVLDDATIPSLWE